MNAMRNLGLGVTVIAAALAVCGLPAKARTRDEVMSGAYRCAGIGDPRIWLDCYYGAAQPVRAALGLQPAPAAQVELVLSPPVGTPPQASATRDAVLLSASHCSELDDDRQWLNCYYVAAQPMRTILKLPAAPQASQMTNQKDRQPPSQTASSDSMGKITPSDKPSSATVDGFGLRSVSSRVNFVTGRMTSYSFDRKGIFTVALSNGEVWRQLSGDTSFAHWKGQPEKYIVRISRGSLGSFNLEVRNISGMFKVHRLQ